LSSSAAVLVDACTQVRALSHSIAAGDGLRVAVNISGRHLQQGNLVGMYARARGHRPRTPAAS